MVFVKGNDYGKCFILWAYINFDITQKDVDKPDKRMYILHKMFMVMNGIYEKKAPLPHEKER